MKRGVLEERHLTLIRNKGPRAILGRVQKIIAVSVIAITHKDIEDTCDIRKPLPDQDLHIIINNLGFRFNLLSNYGELFIIFCHNISPLCSRSFMNSGI